MSNRRALARKLSPPGRAVEKFLLRGRRFRHGCGHGNGGSRGDGCGLVLFLTCRRKRLRALGIVAIDGHGLQSEFPGLGVGLHDVFDRRFFRHVDGLADRAGNERLRCRHHAEVTAPGNRAASSHRRQRTIEHVEVFGLEARRAFDRAVRVDVIYDLRHLLRRITELHQRLRHRVVDDFDHAATDEPLLLYEREVRLDARRVAIHHEADRARGRQHGDLRVFIAEALAQLDRVVP